ncbi:MAG TPA: chemotaxis protein CheW [Anaeromyxobacteraceae bacterium]|nr:chemotaxis protein CheW [Anaeromyxobacteraceae bacterium]
MTATREGAGEGERAELCTFRVGGEDYAVDIMRVREIINPLPVTPVPRAPRFIEGVVRLRSEVIPVVDVRKRFGLPAAEPTRKTRFLVVRIGGRRLALVVDEVTEVVRLARSEIRPAPTFAEGGAPRFFLGVCGGEGAPARGGQAGARRGPGRLRLLLNVKALLEVERPGEAEAARAQAEATRGA